MPKNIVKTKHDEGLWFVARGIAGRQYGLTEKKDGGHYWAVVNGIFHSLKNKHDKKKKKKKVATQLYILAAELNGLPENYPKKTGEETAPGQGNAPYTMSVSKDKFLHFTSPENAEKIVKEKRLRWDKVGSGPNAGISAIAAVSAIWGTFVPRTQIGTPGARQDIVAVEFTTHKKPSYGYVEEVLWHEDVPLDTVKIIPADEAKTLLLKNPIFEESREVSYID